MAGQDCGLRRFVIPKIIGAAWAVAVGLAITSVVGSIFMPWYLGERTPEEVAKHLAWAMIVLPIILLLVRVLLESLSVLFSIHDRLEDILEELQRHPLQAPTATQHPPSRKDQHAIPHHPDSGRTPVRLRRSGID